MSRIAVLSVVTAAVLCVITLPPAMGKHSCVDSMARHTHWPRVENAEVPVYPIVAIQAGIAGTVKMSLTIRKGLVASVKELAPAPPILVAVAKQNAKTWRFSKAVNGTIKTSFVFQISTQESERVESPEISLSLPSFVLLRARRVKVKPVTLYGY